MEQRLSLVTLGVADLARARTFYEEPGCICHLRNKMAAPHSGFQTVTLNVAD